MPRQLGRTVRIWLVWGTVLLCHGMSTTDARAGQGRVVAVPYSFQTPRMQTLRGAEAYVSVSLPDCAELHSVGEPALPFRTARILLPPGCKLAGVRAELLAPVQALNLSAPVEFGRTAIPFGPDRAKALAQAAKDAPDPRIYNSDAPYPAERARLLSVQRLHGHDIALVSVFPVQYVPAKKQLLYCPKIRVELELSATLAKATTGRAAKNARTRAAAVAAFVDNPQAMTEYGEGTALLGPQSSQDPVPRPAGSTYDYLLITSSALRSSFDPLVAQKVADGLSVKTETVETIYADPNNTGRDSQEKIRNYIQYAYTTWGIQYVLLGGDTSVVPHRGAYGYHSSVGAITDMPTDLYYSCLDGSWNGDGDGLWGEPDDGNAGGDVDLLGEVYVGRAPVDTPSEVATFVNKIVSYEQSGTPNVAKARFLAEYLGDANYHGTKNQGHDALAVMSLPHFNGFTVDWLDDWPYHSAQWTTADCIAALNQSPHIVAHVGHGSETYVARLSRSDTDSLTNAHLFLLNSTACDSGAFDYSDCIGEDLSKRNDHGAFAVIMNTRDGWYTVEYTYQYSAEFQGKFFDRLLTQGIHEVGRALQLSKQDIIGKVERTGSMPYRWCYFTITLLGDPHTALKTFPIRNVNVKSFDATPTVNNYFTGVGITLNPPTNHGTTRSTEFTETYADGIQATLTAPESYSNLRFQRWQLDSIDQPERQQSLAVTMAADHAAVAVYRAAPILSLVEATASQYVRPGETVTVKLNVSGLTGHNVNSVQTLLEYDATRLGDPRSVARSAAPPWSDGTESGPTYDGSKVDYGITLAGSTSADAEVAVLTFTAGSTEGTAYVRFRADEPAAGKVTKLTELPGPADLFPVKQDAGPIVIDGTSPSVVLSSPNGGETFTAGDWCEIAWSVTEANPYTITLEYSTNGGASWTLIDTFDWDFGSYWWEVPAVNSNACRVRVKATDGAGNFGQDMSDANFTITSPVLTVKSFNTTSSAYFTGVTVTVDPAPDGVTEFARPYVAYTDVTLTAPQTHASLTFVRWRLDGADQTQGERVLTVTMDDSHEVVAVYQASQGLVIDMQVLTPGTGELNPTGPAPKSLTIVSITMPGDPQTTQIAITIGGGQWLQLVTDSQNKVDVYPTGAAAEWHTAAEWASKRIRGLTPNTTYSFQAKTRDGPVGQESELSDVGSYSTNRDRDVDRSGTVDGTDLTFARNAVLSDAGIGQAGKAWATDVNDSRTTTVYDVTQIRNRILGVD